MNFGSIFKTGLSFLFFMTLFSCQKKCIDQDYIDGCWNIISVSRSDNLTVPLTDSSICFTPYLKAPNSLNLPTLDLQPLPNLDSSTVQFELNCDQDSMLWVDRKYDYFSGRYKVYITGFERDDTLYVESDKFKFYLIRHKMNERWFIDLEK